MTKFIRKTDELNFTNVKNNAVMNVYNVVILDKSGSMSCISKAAVDGFNETLGAIKASQKENTDTQRHYVSLYAFCGCGVEVLIEDEPVENVKNLRYEDYNPCCMTPLFDAMGLVFSRYAKMLPSTDKGIVVATIITDGEENASTDFNSAKISKLIDGLKERGWLFSYIGANQDAHKVAQSMNIDNAMDFDYSADGTQAMFKKESKSRQRYFKKMQAYCCMAPKMSDSEKTAYLKEMGQDFFKESDNKK